jgi:hypothetical protein
MLVIGVKAKVNILKECGGKMKFSILYQRRRDGRKLGRTGIFNSRQKNLRTRYLESLKSVWGKIHNINIFGVGPHCRNTPTVAKITVQ